MTTFEDLKISKSVLKAIEELGFTEPTPIQEKAIPMIRSGVDVLGIAQTGTGKTAAYFIPLIMKLVKAEGNDPRAIVLVPTRELAIQVGEDLEDLTKFTNLRRATVYGGVGWTKHAELIKPGVDILVATPGRLWDLYRAEAVSFKKVKTLVIDEADRMLDMGFMPQIRNFLEVLPVKRQNLLFSATFNEKVEEMSHEFLDFPERVEVAPSATPAELINQVYYRVPNFQTKLNLINYLLRDEENFTRVIIFVSTKENAEQVFKIIKRRSEGEKRIMHSNKGQSTRLNAINAFKSGVVRILITTDISSRGIDVELISRRTARANNTGTAISLVNPAEELNLHKIEALIRMEIPRLELPADLDMVATKKEENQDQLREIDRQKRVADPTFKGAFHEKKFSLGRAQKKEKRNLPKDKSKEKQYRKRR